MLPFGPEATLFGKFYGAVDQAVARTVTGPRRMHGWKKPVSSGDEINGLTHNSTGLHWFNPLVHLMSREIEKACEFSCDEAVLAKMGRDKGQEYGKVLLDAMAAVGRYKENPGAVTLNRNKKLLNPSA